ncbi:putative adenylyl-sulfate kinase, partial [Dissostichus eleginoides]
MMGGDSGARGNMGEREETEIEKGMGSGGWDTDTHIGTVRQSMELQCGAVIVLIIALSAAPVRQTVRGSLGGVGQGSAIGLLEKAPPYRTPTVRSTGGHQESGPGSKETCWGRPLDGD